MVSFQSSSSLLSGAYLLQEWKSRYAPRLSVYSVFFRYWGMKANRPVSVARASYSRYGKQGIGLKTALELMSLKGAVQWKTYPIARQHGSTFSALAAQPE